MKGQLLILPLLLAASFSTAVTYLTILIYRGLGWVDRSTKREHPKHIHTEPVPRGGGIPIFAAMLLSAGMFLGFDQHVAAVMLGALIILVTGILDDVMDLSPYIRLGIGMAAAGVVVASGIGIEFISNPLGGGVWELTKMPIVAELLAILWIVWTMNFVNMGAKGLDGQLPGVTVVAASVMGILSFRFVNDVTVWPAAYLSFALAGSYLGLWVFNRYPQKIMPGWGGGALAGYFLAVLAILSGAKVATALIVLGVPLMDVVYAIGRRILAGKNPVWGDDQHLHHRLLKAGWSKRRIANFYTAISATLGIAALSLNSQMKIYTILLNAVLVGGLLVWASCGLPWFRYGRRSG